MRRLKKFKYLLVSIIYTQRNLKPQKSDTGVLKNSELMPLKRDNWQTAKKVVDTKRYKRSINE